LYFEHSEEKLILMTRYTPAVPVTIYMTSHITLILTEEGSLNDAELCLQTRIMINITMMDAVVCLGINKAIQITYQYYYKHTT
jgi:hypothetical protein